MNQVNRTNLQFRLTAAIVAISLLCLRCESSVTRASTASHDVIYFHVASACSAEKLGGVSVSAINLNGEQVDLGKSHEGGLVVVGRGKLENARVILFCADDHFCTAIETPTASAGTEITVLLAPFVIS